MSDFQESINNMAADSKIFVDKSMAIASRIAEVLAAKGMMQMELAEKADMNESEVSRAMAGMQNLTLRTISKIEAALGESLIEVVASPSLPDETDLEKEAEKQYPDKRSIRCNDTLEDVYAQLQRTAYISARRKSITREKELEEHLKNIYEMYGDEWSEYAREWTEKVLRNSNHKPT